MSVLERDVLETTREETRKETRKETRAQTETPRLNLTPFYLPLLMLLCVAFAWRPLSMGDDFWAHAAVGRWMWENGQVARETLFLWSARQDWVWHSWGSQAVFYALMHVGGERGGPFFAQLLTCSGAAFSFALVWRLWAKRGNVSALTPLLFALGIWVAGARFHPRPELFSALFLVILLSFLAAWPREMQGRALKVGALIGMFALWANLHGGVALGLVMLWATVFCDLVQRRTDKNSRALLLAAIGCTLIVNLNPWGADYWSALKPVSGPMFKIIDEWKPMWHKPAVQPEGIFAVALLGACALYAWLSAPRHERRLAHLAWLLVMAFFVASARRHIWNFALVSLLVCALHSSALGASRVWMRFFRREASPFLRFAAPVLACASIFGLAIGTAKPELWRAQAKNSIMPDRAVAWLQTHQNDGPIWNEYLMSSYLHWKMRGRPPLSIDLLNAYPDQFMVDYRDALFGYSRGLRKLESSPVNLLILPKTYGQRVSAPLRRHLKSSPNWRVVFQDQAAIIYKRQNISPKIEKSAK